MLAHLNISYKIKNDGSITFNTDTGASYFTVNHSFSGTVTIHTKKVKGLLGNNVLIFTITKGTTTVTEYNLEYDPETKTLIQWNFFQNTSQTIDGVKTKETYTLVK